MKKMCKYFISNSKCEIYGKSYVCKDCKYYEEESYIEKMLKEYTRNNL